MDAQTLFRTARLSGRAPYAGATALYGALFGPDRGPARLSADLQDWSRHQVAPWVLFHADHPVGVAGFRIGFGETGLELSFHFLPDVAGQGLASEFVQAALDHAERTLREDRFFAFVGKDNAASIRILEKAGFSRERESRGEYLMRRTLRRGTPGPAEQTTSP
jgi:RimJ/RimL family protein N-acetyltransferase